MLDQTIYVCIMTMRIVCECEGEKCVGAEVR
jgi:hypothetical protein